MREEQCLDLAGCQPRELRLIAIDQPPPATWSTIRDHRHTRRGERVHVAQYRPFGNLEPLRELTRRQPAVHLQQQESGDEAIGAHAATLAKMPDRRCHECAYMLRVDKRSGKNTSEAQGDRWRGRA